MARSFAFIWVLLLVCRPSFGADVDLRPSLSSVKHQGARNTCSAFAAVALAEHAIREATGVAYDLSEEYAYWSGRQTALAVPFTRSLYEGTGGLAGFLAVEGLSRGSVREADWPYIASARAETPPRGLKPRFPLRPIFVPREKIAEFLARERRPVVMNLMWYFDAADSRGDLRMPTPREIARCRAQDASVCSGHVVLLVGFEERSRRYLFRNSWGEAWGNLGYGTLPEAYLLEHCEVCDSLPHLDHYSDEERAFLVKAGQGVSARPQ